MALMADRPVFVFGSNLKGIHGKGSALHARKYYGAVLGVGEGPMGGDPPTCYAIPTKREPYVTMTLEEVEAAVRRFIEYARSHPELTFELVKIGCGNAGFNEHDMIKMFMDAPDNCMLPEGWRTR